MYNPQYFNISDQEEQINMIERNPFGSLITIQNGQLEADHIPFIIDRNNDGNINLLAHVARANPVWKNVRNLEQVMILFKGEDGYISPNWYPGKKENENQVPTWNYQVVNIHGKIEIIDEVKFVRGVVARLTNFHEASEPKPWKMSDSEKEFIDENLKQIVGIKILVEKMEGKYKLSQNRNQRDFTGAAEGLLKKGKTGLYKAMKSMLKKMNSN